MSTRTSTLACAVALLVAGEARAATDTHIRCQNHRILEAFEYASTRSATFRNVVAAVESSNVIVSVAEGPCQNSTIRGCLQLLQATPDVRHVIIRIDPRQPVIAVVRQLAHELQHAAEIAAAPEVIDAASLRRLYATIGFSGVTAVDLLESRAAQDVEAHVARETLIAGRSAGQTRPSAATNSAAR
jgi:hypothetical protein